MLLKNYSSRITNICAIHFGKTKKSGETRLNFFITLVTTVLAALGGLGSLERKETIVSVDDFVLSGGSNILGQKSSYSIAKGIPFQRQFLKNDQKNG